MGGKRKRDPIDSKGVPDEVMFALGFGPKVTQSDGSELFMARNPPCNGCERLRECYVLRFHYGAFPNTIKPFACTSCLASKRACSVLPRAPAYIIAVVDSEGHVVPTETWSSSPSSSTSRAARKLALLPHDQVTSARPVVNASNGTPAIATPASATPASARPASARPASGTPASGTPASEPPSSVPSRVRPKPSHPMYLYSSTVDDLKVEIDKIPTHTSCLSSFTFTAGDLDASFGPQPNLILPDAFLRDLADEVPGVYAVPASSGAPRFEMDLISPPMRGNNRFFALGQALAFINVHRGGNAWHAIAAHLPSKTMIVFHPPESDSDSIYNAEFIMGLSMRHNIAFASTMRKAQKEPQHPAPRSQGLTEFNVLDVLYPECRGEETAIYAFAAMRHFVNLIREDIQGQALDEMALLTPKWPTDINTEAAAVAERIRRHLFSGKQEWELLQVDGKVV